MSSEYTITTVISDTPEIIVNIEFADVCAMGDIVTAITEILSAPMFDAQPVMEIRETVTWAVHVQSKGIAPSFTAEFDNRQDADSLTDLLGEREWAMDEKKTCSEGSTRKFIGTSPGYIPF